MMVDDWLEDVDDYYYNDVCKYLDGYDGYIEFANIALKQGHIYIVTKDREGKWIVETQYINAIIVEGDKIFLESLKESHHEYYSAHNKVDTANYGKIMFGACDEPIFLNKLNALFECMNRVNVYNKHTEHAKQVEEEYYRVKEIEERKDKQKNGTRCR